MVENVHRDEDRYQLNHIWSSFSIFYGVSCMHVQKKETVNRNSTLLGLMNYDNSNERGEREKQREGRDQCDQQWLRWQMMPKEHGL